MIETLTLYLPVEAASLSVAACQFLFDMDRLNGLTSDDIAIYQTPEGTLYNVAILSDGKNDARANSKTKKGADWEQELRAELAKKKESSNKSSAQDALVKAELEKETTRRAQVARLLEEFQAAMDAVSRVAITKPDVLHVYLPELVQLLLPLLKSPLLGNPSSALYLRLAASVTRSLRPISSAIAASILRLTNHAAVPAQWTEEPLLQLIFRVLQSSATISELELLPAPSFLFLYPLLEIILREADSGREEVDNAFTVLLRHCSLGSISGFVPYAD